MRAAFLWLALPALLSAQTGGQPLTLRTETRAVQINVVALDKAGDPIRDLHASDFSIFDNDRPRPVQFFEFAGGAATATPREPGSTAIVLDALNTGFADQSYLRDQALKAIERMPLDESVAVLALTPALKMQFFTRDRRLLRAAIENFQPMMPPYGLKRRVQVTLAALKTLADRMSKFSGRKSIVWITAGFLPMRSYNAAIDATLRKINAADVAVYPVDARGLTLGNGNIFDSMNRIAETTGGRAYYNGNDVAHSIEDAAADSKTAYVIGFYLSDGDRDQRFHTLKVEVDRSGASLRYRRGYSPSVSAGN